MGSIFGETNLGETIIRFINAGDPPGPVPPGPVPPGPTPDPPTPTPGGGGGSSWWAGWTSQTGDTLMWVLFALIAIAAIAFGIILYKNYKREGSSVRTYENPGIGAVCSSLISKNLLLKGFVIGISALIALFACTGIAHAGINAALDTNTAIGVLADSSVAQKAYADNQTPNSDTEIAIQTKGYIDIPVYTDGTYDISELQKLADSITNKSNVEATFYSMEISSTEASLTDVVWKFSTGSTLLFNQTANKPNTTNISLPFTTGQTYNITLDSISNLSASTALSLVGKEVATIKYGADANVIDAPDAEDYEGILQKAFEKDGHDATFASSVSFVKGEEPAEGTYRSVVDVSRSKTGAIKAYMVNDEGGGYHIVVNSDDEITCLPNTCSRMFQNFRNLGNIDYDNLNTTTCTDFSYMFENCGRDDGEAVAIDFSKPYKNSVDKNAKFVTGNDAKLDYMFYGCDCSVDLTNLDTSHVASMNSLFENYADGILDSARSTIELTLEDDSGNKFKIPQDCTVDYMFRGCNYDITNGPDAEAPVNLLTKMDTSEQEHFARMFAGYSYVPPVVEPEPSNAESNAYLDVSVLDVSNAKDMSQMFMMTYGVKPISDTTLTIKFGEKAGDFAPGNAKDVNMYGFFEFCNIINLDLSPIDFSNVTSMDSMFAHYGFLNINLKTYLEYHDVKITWPKSTEAKAFPAPGCKADYMYCATSIEPSVLENWNGKNVDSAIGMFLEYGWNTNYNLVPKDLTVSFPENYQFADNCVCSYMFHQAKCSVDLSNWDASNILMFKGMFLSFGSLVTGKEYTITWADVDKMFTPKEGASFEGMFEMIQLREVDLSHVDLNKVSDLSYMFEGYGQIVGLSKEILNSFAGRIVWPDYGTDSTGKQIKVKPAWPTAYGQEGANLSYMFLNYRKAGGKEIVDLSNWDTSNVRNFQGMFSGFNSLTLLGAGFDGKNVEFPEGGLATGTNANISYMFENSNVYTDIVPETDVALQNNFKNESVGLTLSKAIQTKDVSNFSHVFDGAFSTEPGREDKDSGPFDYRYATIDVSEADLTNATDMSYMFANAFCKMQYGELGGTPELNGRITFNTTKNDDKPTINGEHFFDGCNIDLIDLSIVDTSIFNNVSYFFANYGYVDCHGKIKDFDLFSLTNKTAVVGLFYNSYFDLVDAEGKPQDLEIDWSDADVSEITDMSYMFYNFKPKKLDISGWNPKACVNMEGMFMGFGIDQLDKQQQHSETPYSTTLVLPTEAKSWTTGSECNMKWMFALCCAEVDLSGFDVSKVTNMEGMFMGYGISPNEISQALKSLLQQILQLIQKYLPIPIPDVKRVTDDEIYAALLNGNFDTFVDASTAQLISDYRTKLTSSLDGVNSVTEDYSGLADLSSALVQQTSLSNKYAEYGLDNEAFDGALLNELRSEISSDASLNSATYKNALLQDYDATSSYYVTQIKNIFSEVLINNDFSEFLELANKAASTSAANGAVANGGAEPLKLTLPDEFKPASDASYDGTKRCSMKAMFALFNVTNVQIAEGDSIDNYKVDLSKLDTEFVCDMSFMFTGYLYCPVANPKGSEQYLLKDIDISGFNTSNIGPYDPTSNDANQPIGSMTMMFAVTGSKTVVSENVNKYETELKFSDSFKIPETCDTKLMFFLTSAKESNLGDIDVSKALNLAAMFAFGNIQNLDLSSWSSAIGPVSTEYMFAGYGLLGNLIDKVSTGWTLSLGSKSAPFKLYYSKDPLGATYEDTNTTGMFILPFFSKIDLTNVDVSKRKSLSRMFEFCIIPVADSTLEQLEGAAIDISTWETSNIEDYSYMFAFSVMQGIKIPKFKTSTKGCVCDYMFLFGHVYDFGNKNESSNEKQPLGLDFSESNFENATSIKGMFMAYCFVITSDTLKGAVLDLGTNNFKKAQDASWMFAFCSSNLDISSMKMSGVKNADYMFAFAGFSAMSRIQGLSSESIYKTLSFYNYIKLPDASTTPAISFAPDASTNYMFLLTFAGDPNSFDAEGYFTIKPQTLDLAGFNTENVVSMEGMFMLSASSFNLSSLNTIKVKSTNKMFAGYGLAPTIGANLLDGVELKEAMPHVTFPASSTTSKFKLIGDCDTRFMFSFFMEWPDTTSQEGWYFDLQGINVSELTNFKEMFAFGLGMYNFDLSKWDLSKAKKLDMMFLGYGSVLRLLTDADDPDIKKITFRGSQLKLPTKFPAAPTTETGEYCSASWMFAFASLFNAGETSGKVDNTTLDLSDKNFSGIQNADHMFFAYNFTFSAYDGVLDNFEEVFQNVMWQYTELFNKYRQKYFRSVNPTVAAVKKPLEYVEVKFSSTSATKFAKDANLEAMFALADCSVTAPMLDLSNAKCCDSMFAGFAPSYTTGVDHDGEIKRNHNFELTLPEKLSFGDGCTTRQMFMSYFLHSLNVASFDTSKVKDMTRMFALCRAEEINTASWNTSSCESMEGMFIAVSSKIIDMTNWNYNKVKNMSFMFLAYSNKDVSTSIYFPENNSMKAAVGCNGTGMFALCDAKALMLYGLNVEGFSSVDYMFSGCTNLERINVSVDTDWTRYGLAGSYMFQGCINLTGQANTKFINYHTNIEFARVDGGSNAPGYFTGIWTLDEPDTDLVNDTDVKSIFIKNGFQATELANVTKVQFVRQKPPASGKSISNVKDMIKASIDNNVMTISSEAMVYTRATSCWHLFQDFTSLQTIEFNNNFDTIAATSMQGMFDGCESVSNLDLSSLRTGNVEDFSYMFENFGTNKTTLNFLADKIVFDTNSAKTFEGMFQQCRLSQIDIRNFVYYNAINLKKMFYLATNLTDINLYDLGSYTPDDVNSRSLYHDEHSKYVKADFTSMFENCSSIKYLKIGGFIPANNGKENLTAMFKNCDNLESIYLIDDFRDNWNATTGHVSNETFFGCNKLKNDFDHGINDLGVSNSTIAHGQDGDSSEGIFSSWSKMAQVDGSKPGGIIEQRFGTTSIKDAQTVSLFNGNRPDAEYVLAEADLSENLDKTIMAYKVSCAPVKQSTDATPYNLVVYTEWSSKIQKSSFKNLLNGFSKAYEVTMGNWFLIDLGWDLSGMFSGCTNLSSLQSVVSDSGQFFNPCSVKEMFKNCTSLTNFDMSWFYLQEVSEKKEAPDFTSLFEGCSNLTTIHSPESFDFEKIYPFVGGPDSQYMFKGCIKLAANNVYTYQQCCTDLGVDPNDGPNYKAAKAYKAIDEQKNNHGLFSTGAMLPQSYSGSSIIETALGSAPSELYPDDVKSSFHRIQSVEFFKCFETSSRYKELQGDTPDQNLLLCDPIPLNNAQIGSGRINLYVYAKNTVTYTYDEEGNLVRDWYEGPVGMVISTPENDNRIIYASQNSFRGFCWSMTDLTYFNFEPGENRYDEASYDVSEIIDTSGITTCQNMFKNIGRSGNENVKPAVVNDESEEGIYLDNFDTSNVSNFEAMFSECRVPLISLTSLTPNNNKNLFDDIGRFLSGNEEETSLFSFESATNMKSMFEYGGLIKMQNPLTTMSLDIDMPSEVYFPRNGKVPTRACDASNMFRFSRFHIVDLSEMKFSGVTNFEYMFAFTYAMSIHLSISSNGIEQELATKLYDALSNNDEAKLQDLAMFIHDNSISPTALCGASNADNWIGTNFMFGKEKWGPTLTGYPISMAGMFFCSTIRELNLQGLNTENVVSMQAMFAVMPFINNVNVSKTFETSNVGNMNRMFWHFGNIIGTSKFGIYDAASSTHIFPEFKIKEDCVLAEMFSSAMVPVDLSGWTTVNSNACGLNNCDDYTDMFYQFGFYVLPPKPLFSSDDDSRWGYPENMTIKLPSSGWTPPAGTYMNGMFRGCKANVDLSGITSFSNVIDMSRMFMSFGNGDVTILGYKQVGITLPSDDKWTINPGTNSTMAGMFEGYKGLETIEEEGDTRTPFQTIINKLDTKNVVDMSEMFCGAKVKKIDLTSTKFDTSKVRNMYYMFGSKVLRDSYIQELTLGDNFKIDEVVDMRYMFGSVYDYQSALHTINYNGKNGDWASIIDKRIKEGESVFTEKMFYACVNIIGGKGTEARTIYNVDKVDHTLARPAGMKDGVVVPGYFTDPNGVMTYPSDKVADISADTKDKETALDDDVKTEEKAAETEEAMAEEESVVELEDPFDKIDIALDNPLDGQKPVVLTFFQNIINNLYKLIFSLAY